MQFTSYLYNKVYSYVASLYVTVVATRVCMHSYTYIASHVNSTSINNNNNNELYNAEAALKVQWVEIPMAMNTRIHKN